MSKPEIYVCCHKQIDIPEDPMLLPIQAGAALSGKRFEGFLYDDEGDNISARNRSYCELTALYWAWKHSKAEHIGLFHYRRFLYPELKASRPYRIEDMPSRAVLEKLSFRSLSELTEGTDLIMPKGENMYVSIREHYTAAPYHHGEDLARAEQIVRSLYPEYTEAMESYFSGTVHYFGNICIMKRQLLDSYCTWLFSILEEFDQRTDVSNYNTQERRVDGYLAERLLGVFYMQHRSELVTLELPRVHFDAIETAPDYGNRILYCLLPPGTKRRAILKKWAAVYRRSGA